MRFDRTGGSVATPFPTVEESTEMIDPDEIVAKLKESIPDADVEINDMTGTRDHYEMTVISSEFEGKPLIKQHRLVYDALSEEMEGPIHALQLETKTPDEA